MRKFGDKLLTYPAKSNVKIVREKIRHCIQSALALPQATLLLKLNPLIRGWANYYRHGAAKRTFSRLDKYVHDRLWRWAKRRHPNKSTAWKLRKYFTAAGINRGTSASDSTRIKGTSRVLTLYRAASTKIRRHVKVRGLATPYDPRYTEYFEQRRLRGRRSSASRTPLWRLNCTADSGVQNWLADAATRPYLGAQVGATRAV